MSESEQQGPYRIGRHQPQNLYCGEKYIGVMFGPANTAMIATVLNRTVTEQVPEEEPEHFRDGDGDWWTRVGDGQYVMDQEYSPRSLGYIKETYGTWDEGDA